jgi:hypothetical protein
MLMPVVVLAVCLGASWNASAAEVESRVLTHYVPQDFLETVVRTETWTELPLAVKGGVRKGDTIRIWTGGTVDYGNADQPGENIASQTRDAKPSYEHDARKLALSGNADHAFAVLFKTDQSGIRRWGVAGKPIEIPIGKDKERLWIGFNDLRGRYNDNHLGKGRRHELDPLWIRIEVVRIIVD